MYLRRILKQCTELLAVERDGLLVTGAISLDSRESSSGVMFSDGDHLGVICVAKDVISKFLFIFEIACFFWTKLYWRAIHYRSFLPFYPVV